MTIPGIEVNTMPDDVLGFDFVFPLTLQPHSNNNATHGELMKTTAVFSSPYDDLRKGRNWSVDFNGKRV